MHSPAAPARLPGPRRDRLRLARPSAPAVASAAVLVYALAAAGSALGLDRLPVLSGRVTDEAGVLSTAQEQAVEQELTSLQDHHGVRLWVAVVDSIGVEEPDRLAQGTAEASRLRATDALLLVATDEDAEAMWVGEGVANVSPDEIDRILATRVSPALAQGDVEGAAVAGADALGDAVATAPPRETPSLPTTTLLAALLFAGAAILAARAVWTRRDG